MSETNASAQSGQPGQSGQPEQPGQQRPAFDCRLCGHCCKGTGGIVVSDKDRDRLCVFLGLTGGEFESRHGQRRNGKLFIRSNGTGYCIFFRENAGCGVHAAKPDICRAWPYFRGNLVDSESLELAKDFCPGIPREQPHEEFVQEGLAYLAREELAGGSRKDEAGALQVADLLSGRAGKKSSRRE